MFRLSTTTALDLVEAGGPFLWTILSVMVFFFSVCFKPFSWPILSHNFMSTCIKGLSPSTYVHTSIEFILFCLNFISKNKLIFGKHSFTLKVNECGM